MVISYMSFPKFVIRIFFEILFKYTLDFKKIRIFKFLPSKIGSKILKVLCSVAFYLLRLVIAHISRYLRNYGEANIPKDVDIHMTRE